MTGGSHRRATDHAEELERRIDEIERLLAEGASDAAWNVAHGLKGAALAVDLNDLAVAAAALEASAREGDTPGTERALVSARSAIGRISAQRVLHDLRGALNAVMGYGHLLADEVPDGEAREHARAVIDASNAMHEAIERFASGVTPARRERAVQTPPTAAVPLTVLLVEDDDASADLVTSILRTRTSVTVTRAASVAEARVEIARAEFGLALVDHRLGPDDGLAVVHEIRRVRGDSVPIAVTTAGGASEEAPLLDAGADLLLPKPVAAADLLALVDRLGG